MPGVTVLYFASVRERVGRDQEPLELPERTTDQDLLRRLSSIHPSAAALFACCRITVDQEYISGAVALRPGSEIAVIPPVSGG